MLEQLTQRLEDDDNQAIARYSFNITNLPEVEDIPTLGSRQKALQDSGGSALRTSQDEITKTVLPSFADNLLTDPPEPMPTTDSMALVETPQESESQRVKRVCLSVALSLRPLHSPL